MKKRKEPEDEMDRFIKGLAVCRNCSHVRIAHKVFCLDAYLSRNGKYKSCKCKMFVPKDNLEYIEYMYERSNTYEPEKG